jgi:dTDP-4-dehydrorhamnose 3,5-epimerase-like enzyme
MYSGDNPGIFSRLLDHHKARREVNESADQHILSRSGAEVINAIHKWEIPWYKNQD